MNLFTGTTFRGWLEKAMEQERLDKELDMINWTRSHYQEGSLRQPWRGNNNRKLRFTSIQGVISGQEEMFDRRVAKCL